MWDASRGGGGRGREERGGGRAGRHGDGRLLLHQLDDVFVVHHVVLPHLLGVVLHRGPPHQSAEGGGDATQSYTRTHHESSHSSTGHNVKHTNSDSSSGHNTTRHTHTHDTHDTHTHALHNTTLHTLQCLLRNQRYTLLVGDGLFFSYRPINQGYSRLGINNRQGVAGEQYS